MTDEQEIDLWMSFDEATQNALDTKKYWIFYSDHDKKAVHLSLMHLTLADARQHLNWRYDVLPDGMHFSICVGDLTQTEQMQCRQSLKQATTEQKSELLHAFLSRH